MLRKRSIFLSKFLHFCMGDLFAYGGETTHTHIFKKVVRKASMMRKHPYTRVSTTQGKRKSQGTQGKLREFETYSGNFYEQSK